MSEIREDNLLTDSVIKLIEKTHNLKVEKIKWHERYLGKECDCYLISKTNKTVGIELKEIDIVKAVKQALERRDIFNYSYVVMGNGFSLSSYITTLVRKGLIEKMVNRDIGLIISQENPILVLRSEFHLLPLQKIFKNFEE